MSKFKGLLLTEGMHGMISQVEGLAKALDLDFTHHKVELNSFWKLIPPKFTPISKLTFKNIDPNEFDMIISCGRKSVIPSIYFKKNSKKKVYNIHIQDPKVSLHHFDCVVAPEHDGLSGGNVLLSKGAIHYLTQEEINNNRNYLIEKLDKDKSYLLLILGGPNKYYDYTDQNLVLKNYYHLGIAVDTPFGLTVPVVRDVDQKSIIDLSSELMDLSSRAREKKLKHDEIKGGTFTISSLGGIGGTGFSPIVNPPEVAIMGVSSSTWKQVYDKATGKFKKRFIMPFSLSYDHRVIDGASAAAFTSRFASVLCDLSYFKN